MKCVASLLILILPLLAACSMSSVNAVSTADAPAAIGPYSQAVRAGGFLFTSGQVALRPDGTLVEGDVQVQTRQVFANLGAILEAAGCRREGVVKCTVYLKDMNDFGPMNEIYGEWFGELRPARSTVEVSRLPKDVLVEIDMVVCLAD